MLFSVDTWREQLKIVVTLPRFKDFFDVVDANNSYVCWKLFFFFVLEMGEIIMYSLVASNEYQPFKNSFVVPCVSCGLCLFVGI